MSKGLSRKLETFLKFKTTLRQLKFIKRLMGTITSEMFLITTLKRRDLISIKTSKELVP